VNEPAWSLPFNRSELIARVEKLETAIESIHTMRLNWALVCTCKCSECDIFFEGIRDVLPETQSETKVNDCCPKCDSEICICGLGSEPAGSEPKTGGVE
jgi:hypothetical protein